MTCITPSRNSATSENGGVLSAGLLAVCSSASRVASAASNHFSSKQKNLVMRLHRYHMSPDTRGYTYNLGTSGGSPALGDSGSVMAAEKSDESG